MRNTFNLSYYCRKSKESKGKSPIELSININGKRVFINLPMKYSPEAFERDIKSKKDNELKEYLRGMDRTIMKIQTDMMNNNIALSAETLRHYLRTGGIKTYDLATLFEEFIEEYSSRVTPKTLRKYVIVMELWKKCSPNVNDLNSATLLDGQRFYRYLQERYEQSTVSGMATKMKTIFRYAVDSNRMKINPMSGIKISKGEKEVEYLTEDEIERILRAEMPTPCYERVKDIFVFQLGTGLSYADISNLKEDDVRIQNGTYYIAKKRKKTDVEYTTVLLPFAVDVWKKYGGRLPVISNQRYNIYLKTLQGITGLRKSLHSHLARHSFACYCLNRGIRIEIVSRALGHTNLRQTQHYAKLTRNTVVDELRSVCR